MMLQPFPSFEGWPEGSDERKFDSGPDDKGINADMLSYAETAVDCQKLQMDCAQAR